MVQWAIILKRAELSLPEGTDIVVLGHSHPECAFDQSIINGLANLAQSGESYFYTYQKAKVLLKTNHTVKIVLIEFTNDQIYRDKDEWIWSKKYLDYRLPSFAPFLDFREHGLLLRNNTSGYLGAAQLSFRQNLGKIAKGEFDLGNTGGFHALDESKIDSLLLAPQLKTPISTSRDSLTHNIYYLDSLINLCIDHGVVVALLRTPTHRRYEARGNEEDFLNLLSRYEELAFLDLHDLPLGDCAYRDFAHLNRDGAREFSIWFEKNVRPILTDSLAYQYLLPLPPQ